MYFSILSSAVLSLRMGKCYFSLLLLSISILFSSSALSAGQGEADSANGECVILLHGLARTSRSMDKMEQALIKDGYFTANVDYPSRTMKIQDLASMAVNEGLSRCPQSATRINFVTHSMGGILTRYYLAKNTLPRLGRVVMLGPPNKGSMVTDRFRNERWYKWLTGPAGQQLGTGKDGIPGLLGVVDYSTGIIAGNAHSPVDNWLSEIIPGEDDGKVSVENAKVEGMTDFIVLPFTHISIMKQDAVIQQTLSFLKDGKFLHTTETAAVVQ